MRKLGDVMRDVLHDRDGALADERDRHRVGATPWRAAQRAAWEAREVIGRPYSTAGGKNSHVRVQRVDSPAVTETRDEYGELLAEIGGTPEPLRTGRLVTLR